MLLNSVHFKESDKRRILSAIKSNSADAVISLLDRLSTRHAGTAKTIVKRFAIKEFVKYSAKANSAEKFLFDTGNYLCSMESNNAKEIGVSLIWRGYSADKYTTMEVLLRIADDSNWEVREYAAGAFAGILSENRKLHGEMLKLTCHNSENVRRAALFSALAYKNDKDPEPAFEIIELLLADKSRYVKRNLGPFILGSHYGNSFPKTTMKKLREWSKSSDENVLWNVAMSFNNSFGEKYPEDSLGVLNKLSKVKSQAVHRAVVSTLRRLYKKYPLFVGNSQIF